MEIHGEREQERWKNELQEIRNRRSEWIESILDRENSTKDEQIDRLINTLLTWQELSIHLFETLEIITTKYTNYETHEESDQFEYKHVYSNCVHAFESAGLDYHIRRGLKPHLIERYD